MPVHDELTSTITWSAADSFTRCPRLFYWSYRALLTGEPQNKYITRGVDVHRLLEIWYKTKNIDMVRETLSLTKYNDLDYLERFIVWYHENFNDDIQAFSGMVETELAVTLPGIEGVVYRGKVDLYLPDTQTVKDHKTTGKANGKHWLRTANGGQLQCYSFALMSMGWPVKRGALNVLCWTEKQRAWRHYGPEVPISEESITPWVRYLRDTALAIRKETEDADWPAVKNSMCWWCSFRTPCQEMGADLSWSEEAMCQHYLRPKTREHEELGATPPTPAQPCVGLDD